jgi:hypothetical protein
MADYVPFSNVAEVVLNGEMAGQEIVSVHNFQFPDALTTSILSSLATSVITSWLANLAPILSSGLDMHSVKVTDLTTDSSPSVTVPFASGTDGNLDEAPVPLNVALVLSEATGSRGRSFRGRVYQCGVPESGVFDVGSVTEAYQIGFVNAYGEFFSDIEASPTCVHVVCSRQHNGVLRTAGVATPITSYSANRDFDSQRRRLYGRGA